MELSDEELVAAIKLLDEAPMPTRNRRLRVVDESGNLYEVVCRDDIETAEAFDLLNSGK